jgi:hypothetical protein
MYFSEAYEITNPEQYEWFDPILELDTKLFVDPFLVFGDDDPLWANAHNSVIDYFQQAFELLARSGDNTDHQFYRRAVSLMTFPEPKEVRLGYTRSSVSGSGSGIGLARQVVRGMSQSIVRGLRDMRHFEELGIFVPKFNRDRISDVVVNLLKPMLIAYTQQVCTDHGIATSAVKVNHSRYDSQRWRWMADEVRLPVDPMLNRPIILLPKRFLRELPTLEAGNWYESLDVSIREDLNLDIASRVRKSDVLAAARENIGLYRAWTADQERAGSDPYDVDIDPQLYVLWQRLAKDIAGTWTRSQPEPISSPEAMVRFIGETVQRVRHWVEEQSGWKVFWRKSGEASIPESHMQLLFLGMVDTHCEGAGVRVDREVETGRGPVDFVFSGDQRLRVLVEMKKLNHGEFWHGLNEQTPTYMRSQNVDTAVFLAIRNSRTKHMNERWNSLREAAAEVSSATGLHISIERLDVMPKASASETNPKVTESLVGEDDNAAPEEVEDEDHGDIES